MPILLFIIMLFAPRLVIFLLWFFTQWFTGVFNGVLIPLLGFVFTPYTLLWYTVVFKDFNLQWSFWPILFLVIAIMLDISQLRGRH